MASSLWQIIQTRIVVLAKDSMNLKALKIKKLKSVLEPVARLTPKIRPRLKPLHDIQESRHGHHGTWTSVGDDPQFMCEFPLIDLHTGWYMITLEIECNNVFDIAKLYVDMGHGCIEDESIKIPYQSRKICKRLVKFNRKASYIRFDPMSSKGQFTVLEFTMSPVTFRYAEKRMLTKLMRWNPSKHEETVPATREMLKQQANKSGQSYHTVLERKYSALFANPMRTHNYSMWIEKVEVLDTPTENDVISIDSKSERPRISVIMPTYNSDVELLNAAIQSVTTQSYSNWQLCISDDGSSSQSTISAIQACMEKDQRISVVFRQESSGIAKNTNSALQLAKGDYCVFLDHDDLLAKHALFEVAKVVTDNPTLKLVYSDEDKIDSTGDRVDPHFKPDWNPDLLLSQNYICHLVALSREVIQRVGGCRIGFEGAQDHDLLLRVMEVVEPDEVHHIHKILYHWRMAEGSTATVASAKSYSTDSGIAAIEDHLNRIGSNAAVAAGKYSNTYRVRWPLPKKEPKVSIVIPTRDRLDILSQCIGSVLQLTNYSDYEIIIIDNESTEPSTFDYFEQLKALDNIRVLQYGGEFNYSAINNYAVEEATGSVITLMNNDIEVIEKNWLREMVGHALRPEIGCVGAKLLYKNNMIQHAGVILGIGGVAGHGHKYFDVESAGYFSRLHLTQNMSAVTAACLTIEKRLYQQVGGLNEGDLKIAFNDVDFCLRIGRLGLRNIWTPYALLYHHESVSRGHENTQEKQLRFKQEALYMREQWGEILESDPAYNRNLTLVREDFSLAA